MIIVSITGPTTVRARDQMARSRHDADIFELRLDLMRRPDVGVLIRAARKPVIVTCRPLREGGGFTGSERERIGFLLRAVSLGAAYVDLELRCGVRSLQKFLGRRGLTVIVSRHLASGEPIRVERTYASLRATGAEIVKLAYPAADAWQLRHSREFLSLARADGLRAIAVGMGEGGEAGRILYRVFGAWATYASPGKGEESAPGQIDAATLRGVYRAHLLGPRTRIFGVVGMPVRQSRGVTVHNPLFHRLRLDAVYVRFGVDDLRRFMEAIGGRIAGLSVTIPHKRSIMRYLDTIDPTARAIGAVNTVLRRGKLLHGTNTDAPGALDAIERVTEVRKKTLLVLGTGGAGRAIAYEAKKRGARVLVTNRTVRTGRRVGRDLGVEVVPWTHRTDVTCEIVVNATSVGMGSQAGASPVPASFLKGKTVLDVVFSPPRTRFLRDAERFGSAAVPGTEMYLNQAALQSLLYTGHRPPSSVMRRLLGPKEP